MKPEPTRSGSDQLVIADPFLRYCLGSKGPWADVTYCKLIGAKILSDIIFKSNYFTILNVNTYFLLFTVTYQTVIYCMERQVHKVLIMKILIWKKKHCLYRYIKTRTTQMDTHIHTYKQNIHICTYLFSTYTCVTVGLKFLLYNCITI